jgi:hypothetical protein
MLRMRCPTPSSSPGRLRLRAAIGLPILLLLLLATAAPAIDLPPDAEVQTIHPGAWSFQIIRPEVPLAIYGFVWDLDQPLLELVATAANQRARGLEPMSGQLQPLHAPQHRPVAAVNGDFYAVSGPYRGITVGPFVVDGRAFRVASERPALLVLSDRSLAISRVLTSITIETRHGPIPQPAINATPGAGLVLHTPDWGPSTDFPAESVEVPFRWNAVLRSSMQTEAIVAGDPVTGRGDHPIPADGFVLSAQLDRAEPLRHLRAGDRVRIMETRPLSKDKRWRVVEIIERAR